MTGFETEGDIRWLLRMTDGFVAMRDINTMQQLGLIIPDISSGVSRYTSTDASVAVIYKHLVGLGLTTATTPFVIKLITDLQTHEIMIRNMEKKVDFLAKEIRQFRKSKLERWIRQEIR